MVKKLYYYRYIYLFMLPGIIYFLIFAYFPMIGVGIAFREFSFRNPFFGGAFVGLKYFYAFFNDRAFINVFFNTVFISIGRLVYEFPFAIILALLFNELRNKNHKRVIQTVFTFPHFISWVVASGIIINLLSDNGAFNQIAMYFGGRKNEFMTSQSAFRGLLYVTSNWKNIGWSTIIYLATISNVDVEQYEAALVDGANRFHRVWYITLPALKSVIGVLLILRIANMMDAGFDQIFNMYNASVYRVADIIDTYIYRRTIIDGGNFSMSTAFGLMKSVISAALLLAANFTVKRINGHGIY